MFKKYCSLFFCLIFIFSFFSSINYYNFSKCNWPTANYKQITSYFGFRIHPTTFKESYHSGIDISAPEGTDIHSISNGIVSFIGFNGAYGYSIIVKNNNFEILYAHVSPDFIVNTNDTIISNQIIGKVGPKYIKDFTSNKYYDSNRSSYKW